MNDRDDELFEAELHRLKPARPPEEFMSRLVAARPVQRVQSSVRCRPIPPHSAWWWLLRWLAPATVAVAVVALLVWRSLGPETVVRRQPATASANHALKADDVEIDRRLVAAYDAVAQLPGGEPVRFRCREWTDEVVLRDSARGVLIEQRTPRLEVIPVSFETY